MKIIGLTGSIGMGKSTTAKLLRGMGVPVYCADEAVHAALAAGGAAVEKVAKLYPKALAKNKSGKKFIQRKALGAAAFHDKKLMRALEKILHPLTRKAEKDFLKRAKAKGAKQVVLDIPLLFETGGENRVDAVMVVSAPASIQRARVLARSHMTEEKLRAILKRQMPDREKRRRADVVIPTGRGQIVTKRHLKKFLENI